MKNTRSKSLEATEAASPAVNSILATAATAWALTCSRREAEVEQANLEDDGISRDTNDDGETGPDFISVD